VADWKRIPPGFDFSDEAPRNGFMYLLGSERDRDFFIAAYWDGANERWATLDGISYAHDAVTHYFIIPAMPMPEQLTQQQRTEAK
jgi:hypothetical protein